MLFLSLTPSVISHRVINASAVPIVFGINPFGFLIYVTKLRDLSKLIVCQHDKLFILKYIIQLTAVNIVNDNCRYTC